MMSREIELTKGQVAIVDDEDYEWLSQWKWFANNSRPGGIFYAMRTLNYNMGTGLPTLMRMHRAILSYHGLLTDDQEVDHIDSNGLNNRKSNLRSATHTQNMRNQTLQRNNTSGYIGVRCRKRKKTTWEAVIQANKKETYLGVFKTPEEAARTYDRAARKLHGAFATLNFPKPGERGIVRNA